MSSLATIYQVNMLLWCGTENYYKFTITYINTHFLSILSSNLATHVIQPIGVELMQKSTYKIFCP